MQLEDEKELLISVSQNDEAAFESLFNLYRSKVFGYAIKICGTVPQAEEVVQNVFLQIWINRSALIRVDNFAGYVRVMARNEGLQFLRRLAMENRHQEVMAQSWTEQHNDTETAVHYNEAKRLLDDVLNTLPPQQKLIYSMCHLQGMKQHEIADQLHISPLTVKAHLRQAVSKIRKAMYLEIGAAFFIILSIFI